MAIGSRTNYPARKASSLVSTAAALLREAARRTCNDEFTALADELADLRKRIAEAYRRDGTV